MKNIFLILCLSAFSIQFAMGQCIYVEPNFWDEEPKKETSKSNKTKSNKTDSIINVYKVEINTYKEKIDSLESVKKPEKEKNENKSAEKGKAQRVAKILSNMQFDGLVFKPTIAIPFSIAKKHKGKGNGSLLWHYSGSVYVCPYEIDSIRIKALHRFLIDENSLYGIRLRGAVLTKIKNPFNDAKLRLGAGLGLEFLGNQITSAKFTKNESLVSCKIKASVNFQYANLVTAYVNYNFISPMTNVSVFREYFNTSYLEYNYFDIGLNLILDSDLVSRLNNTKVKLNINLIPTEQAGLKGIYPVEQDKVIPSISLGVVQKLADSDNKKNKKNGH